MLIGGQISPNSVFLATPGRVVRVPIMGSWASTAGKVTRKDQRTMVCTQTSVGRGGFVLERR
jgi:hypothetical protein